MTTKKLAAIFICCILTGGVMMMSAKAMGYKKSDGKTAAVSSEGRYLFSAGTEPFKNIKIDGSSLQVQVLLADGYAIEIDAATPQDIKWSVSNGAITVKQERRYDKGQREADKIKISVPHDFNCGKTDIDLSSGKFEMAGISCTEHAKIKLTSGKADISKGVFNKGIFEMSSGNISLEDISFAVLDINMTSGKFKGRGISSKQTAIDITSGQMELDGSFSGRTDIIVTSGKINFNTDLPASQYKKKISATSGQITINGKKFKSYEDAADAPNSITVNMTSGAAALQFAE